MPTVEPGPIEADQSLVGAGELFVAHAAGLAATVMPWSAFNRHFAELDILLTASNLSVAQGLLSDPLVRKSSVALPPPFDPHRGARDGSQVALQKCPETWNPNVTRTTKDVADPLQWLCPLPGAVNLVT